MFTTSNKNEQFLLPLEGQNLKTYLEKPRFKKDASILVGPGIGTEGADETANRYTHYVNKRASKMPVEVKEITLKQRFIDLVQDQDIQADENKLGKVFDALCALDKQFKFSFLKIFSEIGEQFSDSQDNDDFDDDDYESDESKRILKSLTTIREALADNAKDPNLADKNIKDVAKIYLELLNRVFIEENRPNAELLKNKGMEHINKIAPKPSVASALISLLALILAAFLVYVQANSDTY